MAKILMQMSQRSAQIVISYHKLLLESREWRSIYAESFQQFMVNGKLKEVPTPHAATNQVLIKIHASGLCYTDVHITEGHLPTGAFPRILVMNQQVKLLK